MNRNLTNRPNRHDGDLQWMAFCYVADELTEDEKSNFENRLQDDPAAQQAVVDAMQQAQAIYAAIDLSRDVPQPERVALLDSPASFPTRGIPQVLFAAAAGLMLLVAGWAWYANQGTPATAGTHNESELLADAWVYTHVAMSENEWNDEFDDEPPVLEVADEASEDWMFVALTNMDESLEGAE